MIRILSTVKLWTMGAFFLFAFLCISPEAARGHTFPDHADPKVGATLTVSPDHVRIWFDSALEPAFSTIMVHRADDTMVDNKDGGVNPSDAQLLEVSVPRLPQGTYHVIWSVVAKDGHRTNGEYTFVIK
jgi:copper resistance protein C